MIRNRFESWFGVVFAAFGALGCGDIVYGDLPAKCESVCPDGYACIHGVCAKPGTPIPVTVARPTYLRGVDLRVVPQSSSILVLWETYANTSEGQTFFGARVTADGTVSPRMGLVTSFDADPAALEPFFDALALSDVELLLSVSSSPRHNDVLASPRLITYHISLPPEGQESSSPLFTAAWDVEERMGTIGFGDVSLPILAKRETGVQLGYMESTVDRTIPDQPETTGNLVVFPLNDDGTKVVDPIRRRARSGATLAVRAWDAFVQTTGVWWVLDDVRPTVFFGADMGESKESRLAELSIPIAADANSLTYLVPSERLGEKLPQDPVSGPSWLRRVQLAQASASGTMLPPVMDEPVAELPAIRGTPRPSFLAREGKPLLLAAMGEKVTAPMIDVYKVDVSKGTAERAWSIDRMSSRQVDALNVTAVGDKVFVTWLEYHDEGMAIRVTVLDDV